MGIEIQCAHNVKKRCIKICQYQNLFLLLGKISQKYKTLNLFLWHYNLQTRLPVRLLSQGKW